jgi:hypothetical protein
LVALTGCFEDEPAPQPPVQGEDDFLFFGGRDCDALRVEAAADAAAIDARLPDGFTAATTEPLGQGMLVATLVRCLQARIGDTSITPEEDLNFWYVEALVSPPEWAAGNGSHAFVLGLYTHNPHVLQQFPRFNVTVAEGLAVVGAEESMAEGPDGAVSFSQTPTADQAPSYATRHFFELSNGTIAAWEDSQTYAGGSLVLAQYTADLGTVWGDTAGPSGLGTGVFGPNYRFGTGFIYWIGPPA